MQTTRKNGRTLLAALALCGLCLLAVTGLTHILQPPKNTEPKPEPASAPELPARLFKDWPKPELALLLSAEQHGYLLPCGCSRPQVGGLERRHNLLELLRAKGWPLAALDLGDIPQRQATRQLPNIQGLLKYRYSMEALKKMGYVAVGLGEYEASQSLFELLGEFALNNEKPAVVAANLSKKDEDYPGQVKSYLIENVKGSKLKLGVAGLIAPSVGAKIKTFKVNLDDQRQVIPGLIQDLQKNKADLNVLLYQGSLKEAKTLAQAHPEFHVILSLSDTDEPSSEAVRVGNTLIAAPGHKGRHVGVVGVWPTGTADKPFEFRYQLVTLGEDFMTPEAQQDKQPVLKLMEQYTRELKSQNYLARFGGMKHPSQVAIPGAVPSFVGSGECKKCHSEAYEVWHKSKHAHAYESLVQAKQPSLRQHDAECIVCHTVGFGYESGYRNEKDTPKLKDVGCESCHGPASEHVKKPNDERWYPVLNPWRRGENETPAQKETRMLRIDNFCQGCHDIDNDVNYKFDKRWPPVAH